MNTAMNFERVIEAYIVGFQESSVYGAGIYNSDLFGARSMIYTILTTQASCFEAKYSDVEIQKMYELKGKLSSEKPGELGSLVESIEFLESLIGR